MEICKSFAREDALLDVAFLPCTSPTAVHRALYKWAHCSPTIPALAQAGYRVLALDMKGYGESSAPHEIEEYCMEVLCKQQHVSKLHGAAVFHPPPGRSPGLLSYNGDGTVRDKYWWTLNDSLCMFGVGLGPERMLEWEGWCPEAAE
ncbi:hypothetical protein P7K49_027620 [Saguinus oedipus]|uniref:AB hydrolase-1 domain-containing protein n=1 Tax=Saguinus oedipus TaxID=9490 RepID=A0ABQ9UA05_SAGOE|nr:hypothetical protein P7K49_027620 [Saguinus oedipus]